MEHILIDVGGIVQLIITLFLLPLWISLCFSIPYIIGKGINRVLLKGEAFSRLRLLFAYIGGIGFFALFVFLLVY